MEWDSEALNELNKAPEFVREMAKQIIEEHVKSRGRSRVTVEDVKENYEKYVSFLKKGEEKKETRIAVIRCDIVSEVCPGSACLNAFFSKKVYFEKYGPDSRIVGFFTCGGCPGRRIPRLLRSLKNIGDVDYVHLSSCMMMEGNYPPCPHKTVIKEKIEKMGFKVVEGTHH
jgi:predicted metal-binding protein